MLDFVNVKSTKKTVISLVVGMLMVLAMMPGMAFATSVQDGYDVDINDPGTVTTADAPQMSVTKTLPSGVADSDVHVEWVSSDTDIVKVGRNKGLLAIQKAGTVTITAELRSGAAANGGGNGDGTGGGNQSGGQSSGTLLATDAINLTITEAAYGFQGLGGNGLMMTNPSSITALAPTTLTLDSTVGEKTRYNNVINTTVSAVDDTISFGYTMSAGINNFQTSTFQGYQNDIGIYAVGGSEKLASISLGGFENRIVTINADVSDLDDGDYILRFGPSVCGNNVNKKLDCYIDFKFTLSK